MSTARWCRTAVRIASTAIFGLSSISVRAEVPNQPELDPGVRASSGEASNRLRVEEEWVRGIFGQWIGASGLEVVDLDGSGLPKILAGGAYYGYGGFWHVISYSAQGYRQEWISSFSSEYRGFRAADLDGAPGAEVVVSRRGEVLIHDGATLELLHRVPVAQGRAYEIGDADGDGEIELVGCQHEDYGGGLYVYDLMTGRNEYHAPEYSCWSAAIGNVDRDPNPEIILGNRITGAPDDLPSYIIDGATHRLEGTYDSSFGRLVRLGDLDGDGMEEIVAADTWSLAVTIYDADVNAVSWEIPVEGSVDALRVMDVEGDGRLDIVYGESVHGYESAVHIWDAQAREFKWSVPSPKYGVTDMAVGDPDGDGVNELVWGTGQHLSGSDYLVVVDTETQVVEWQSLDLGGPFRALDFGDVDHDGQPELLYGSSSSDGESGDGLLFIHDARTKVLEYQSPNRPVTQSNPGLWRIRHADVDGDPQAELFLSMYPGKSLLCLDGVNRTEQWRWAVPEVGALVSLEVADVDADGELEVIGGAGTFPQGEHLYILDAATGTEEWRSASLGTGYRGLTLLRVADVDDDRHLEIVVAESEGPLFIYDGVTRVQELQTADLDITALETVDRDSDGTEEILIGTNRGEVWVLDASTGDVKETLGEYGVPIDGVTLADLTGDFVLDPVLALSGEVRIYDGLAPSELLWRSGMSGPDRYPRVGEDDTLRVADIDEDGKLEILVGLGHLGVKVYQVEGYGPSPPDPPPGFYLAFADLPGFRFKVRITAGDRKIIGIQEIDCLGETLCVSGALPGRSELFARIIGPRPNGHLWVNLVRFTPSRVEVWVEQTATGRVNYYDLPELPREDTELVGLVDKEAFSPEGDAPAAFPIRDRPLGGRGITPLDGGRVVTLAPALDALPGEVIFTSPDFPGYRFTVRILTGGEEQPARIEADCIPETVCVSGALPGRSELFLRVIGPRPNGYLWTNLVRFTTSRVEVDVEQLATGQTRTYVLEQVPLESDELPGRVDKEAFVP